MAKNKISEFSSTPANNTDIAGINIAEGCAPSGINNAIRELMAQLKDQQTGTDADDFTVGGNLVVTGTATGSTPTAGDSTTKFATTAFVQAALAAVYPVGSIYVNATSSTNPATLLGFGTWVAFGAGRVMVGLDAGNAAFDTAEETGGSANAITVSHTHTGTTVSAGTHNHNVTVYNSTDDGAYIDSGQANGAASNYATTSAGAHTHTFTTDPAGSPATNANLQPYIVVYMWKRTV